MAISSFDSETISKDVEKAQEMETPVTVPSPTEVVTSKVEGEDTDLSPDEMDAFEVELDPEEDPKNMPAWRKWLIMIVVCTAACCGTCATSMAAFAETGISHEFYVSKEAAILGVSLSIGGVGNVRTIIFGPLSEIYGRSPIYRVSYLLFFTFCWPVAFAPDIGVYLTFRFITGFFSSAFVSVAGGTVSDMYQRHKTAIPMAIYALSPFIGPMLGPLISGFVNQNVNWRWTFHVITIWVFAETILIFVFIPETYEPVLRKHKAARLRGATGESRYHAPLDRRDTSLGKAILFSCYMPFKLLAVDRMNLLMDIWTAILLGILYLAFQAWPFIFGQNHGFNIQSVGLAFIGIGIGMTGGCLCNVALILHTQRKYEGTDIPPEALLLTGKVGAVIVPASLYWLAFTSYPHVHWIVPITASMGFGTGFLLCFTSVLTYLVAAYKPLAASSLSANAFVRSIFAAAFPLFAGQMYETLGTDGATALLTGILTIAIPLPYVFSKTGARLRAQSPYATH